MAHKQLLHELLKEDQEPFHLQSYIADRRSSHPKKPSPTTVSVQLMKRKLTVNEISPRHANLRRHACFFSFTSSPDIRKSPSIDFYSPAKSPCNSVFLHVPPRTADLLLEAALRIQRQHLPKPNSQSKKVGFGLFGSFLKRLKDRSKNKKLAIEDVSELGKNGQNFEQEVDKAVRTSCSCSNPRLSSADWTGRNEDKSVEDLWTSTSCCCSECSDNANGASRETPFNSSPFRFSLRRSPLASGRRTPDSCSPATSPCRHIKQEKEKSNLDNAREEEEEKEQCSPVSVLDPPFEEEDDEHKSRHADEDDYDLECGYANVQRTKQQLLYRLRRFEKLAELEPMELERKLLEESSDELHDSVEGEEFQNNDPSTLYRKHSADAFAMEVFNQSSSHHKMSTDMKRLVSDLIVEEKSEIVYSGNREVALGGIRNRLDSWKEVEFDTIDMMIESDFMKDFDGWMKHTEQVEETAAEIEVAIYGLLVRELSEESVLHGWT